MAGPHLHVVRRDNLNRAWAKSRTSRIVPVGTWVLAFYDRYVGERLACPQADRSDFVFVNLFHAPLGSPMTDSAVRQLIAGLGRRAGLGRAVTPHMLRHSTAEEMVEAGVGIDVVQQLHVSFDRHHADLCAHEPTPITRGGQRGRGSHQAATSSTSERRRP